MVNRKNEKSNGETLNSSLTLGEFMEFLLDLPLQVELGAEWIRENDEWICSWCRMKSYTPFIARYCYSCGRCMKVRSFDGNNSE